MPQVDQLVNVTDDALTHRELIALDAPVVSARQYKNHSLIIQELHQERLESYAKKRKITVDKATYELMRLHREQINIASHISYIIGTNHNAYMHRLTDLHENPWFIR
jgi:hypothetical protein